MNNNKLKAIVVIIIVFGAVGVTYGVIALTQSDSMEQLLFLLSLSTISRQESQKNWTWAAGTYLLNQLGIYGTKGVTDANNIPGARYAGCSWIDSKDNLWLFGGMGYDNVTGGSGNYLNDLWKFDTTTLKWTWLSGNYSGNSLGTYGIKSVADANNVPGARYLSGSWIDSNDTLWLFGGEGYNNETGGYDKRLNDLWKFNTSSLEWTWVSGNYSINQTATYGMKGVADANNVPGAMRQTVTWIDSDDNLWLFGGRGYNNESVVASLNALWKFNTTTLEWTWMSGNYTLDEYGNYGINGVADANNYPGARNFGDSWIDSNDNLWLFGGYGRATSTYGSLNDLWKFDGVNWTWVSGDDEMNQHGTYGSKGVADVNNVPGARRGTVSWIDSNDTLWLFGGDGYDNVTGADLLNDLWKFNTSSLEWTWTSGNYSRNSLGIYGTKGVAHVNNAPGSRYAGFSWIDSKEKLWLFGGQGYNNSIGGYGWFLNDLWKYLPPD